MADQDEEDKGDPAVNAMVAHKQLQEHLDNAQTHLDNADKMMTQISAHIKGMSAQMGGGKGGAAGQQKSSKWYDGK